MKIMTKPGLDQPDDVLDSMLAAFVGRAFYDKHPSGTVPPMLRYINISTTLDMYMHMRIRTQGWWISLAFRMHALGKNRLD
jgi:hypothetical protein